MSLEGFTQRESILQTIIHAQRRMHEASEAHDIEAVAIAGSYMQGMQDVMQSLIGIPETKHLFRCARRVVEQDAQYATQRGFSAIESLLLIAAIGIITALSGCSGVEVGGKFGVYAVDERADSSKTYRRPALKCLFVSCPQTEEVQGS